VCSTPYGITGLGIEQDFIESAEVEASAQRLTASQV